MSANLFDAPLCRDGEKGVDSTDALDDDEPPPDVDDYHVGEWTDHVVEQHSHGSNERADEEPTTWEPIDVGPYLRGEVERPQPSVGIYRSDGLRLLYPGREHAVVGATESGKTWYAAGSAAAEIADGHRVI